ncbi:MAG: 2-phosphosulfolactate phosphatase [Asgard group archaeon]|nr:2-phosphosulfolactate phosphatase [Asgard group archaeon]
MPIHIESPFTIRKLKTPGNAVYIVVDTFRATSSLVTLKNSGVENIIVVKEGSFAKKLRKENFPNYFLIGEEGGLKIHGFDYGNSPSLFHNQDFRKKNVIFTSTSGAKTILILKPHKHVFLGSLVNLNRISTEVVSILNEEKSDLYIIPAGYYKDENAYTVEDWVTSLLIAHKVIERTNDYIESKNEFFLKTKQLHEKNSNIVHLLKNSPNAKRLRKLGFADDVNFALSINIIDNFLKVKKWENYGEINCIVLE